jgi:hypothetical protein
MRRKTNSPFAKWSFPNQAKKVDVFYLNVFSILGHSWNFVFLSFSLFCFEYFAFFIHGTHALGSVGEYFAFFICRTHVLGSADGKENQTLFGLFTFNCMK